jgi:hypothetical protein
MEGAIEFKDPRQIVEFNCEIAGLNFPDFGDYRFEILIDGQLLVARKFQISKN